MADQTNPLNDILEDDSFADGEALNVPQFSNTAGIKHSATTDTLDSVVLEASQFEDEFQEEAENELTGVPAFEDDADGATQEGANQEPHGESCQDEVLSEVDSKLPKPTEDPMSSPMKISSYFTSGGTQDTTSSQETSFFDEIGSGGKVELDSPTKDIPIVGEQPLQSLISLPTNFNLESVMNGALGMDVVDGTLINNDNNSSGTNLIGTDHSTDTGNSLVEPASVAFESVSDETNVMEGSMHVIDDKEDFEHFTAEADPDIDPDIGLSMSPANKTLSEKMGKMHLADTIQVGDIESVPVSYDRQFSASSAHSAGSMNHASEITEGSHLNNHQPPSNTVLPPLSPAHAVSQEGDSNAVPQVSSQKKENPEKNTSQKDGTWFGGNNVSMEACSSRVAFESDDTDGDPFATSIHMSDVDRQHDAWIPSESTRLVFLNVASSLPGRFSPNQEHTSNPRVVVDDPQGDPVRDLVHRYMGEQEAIKRQVLNIDKVSHDVEGLKKLMKGGCYRSAIELTGTLLSQAGQGAGETVDTTEHTSSSLQIWFCRFLLMMKLKLYNVVESEIQAFHNMDTPDLYYEYYPHLYPGRKGSMVPFGMRMLHAELPHYLGRSQEALDRLHYCLAITQKIISNLNENCTEDGSPIEISESSRESSLELWSEREKKLLYLIGNTFLAIRDYEASMTVYEALIGKDPDNKHFLLSGMGLVYLQMGNVTRAKDYFKQAEVLTDSTNKVMQCRVHVNKGLEAMCSNNFQSAYDHFKSAVNLDGTNASAVNNLAVCSLYLGKLKEALKVLEKLVHENPAKHLHEGILFNLCTLYELESSRALHKKQALLDLVSRHKGDGFPVACLKMA